MILAVVSLALLAACEPATPTGCDVDGDCQAVFNRCSCSWVCLNQETNLDDIVFDEDFGLVQPCGERTCVADVNPQLAPPKPDCGCVSRTEQGDFAEGSSVVRDCRVV